MKTKEEVLSKKNLHASYLRHGDINALPSHSRHCNFCQYEHRVLEAMDEYAAQFKYDYSKSCECKDRSGESWCCNQCGLPAKESNQSEKSKFWRHERESLLREIESLKVQWISCKDRLPENREVVLIHWEYEGVNRTTSGSYVHVGQYWQHSRATQLKVTHWMPLPKGPVKI